MENISEKKVLWILRKTIEGLENKTLKIKNNNTSIGIRAVPGVDINKEYDVLIQKWRA